MHGKSVLRIYATNETSCAQDIRYWLDILCTEHVFLMSHDVPGTSASSVILENLFLEGFKWGWPG